MNVFNLLSGSDWLALIFLLTTWISYAWYSAQAGTNLRAHTLLSRTNILRSEWMLQATVRDPRVIDAMITQSLSASPSFFASTSILIIGGLLALLGTSERVAELAKEIPFVVRSNAQLVDFKVLVLLVFFTFAFFRFTWSMRLYTFAGISIGAMPSHQDLEQQFSYRQKHAQRASNLLGLAAEAFNGGLRAYYFAFAAIAWVISPWASIFATLVVLGVLYQREFRSEVLDVLQATD